ncbi:hypothetical protein GALL_450400 [mine drainage metagenome]|uniref:Uncharacterized protein n=1 Tax=mine drainage metagenome TaxID=410659 RepID=A0A1J5Q782_9ZZZZ
MVVLAAPALMLALPAATTPPTGKACTWAANDRATDPARVCKATRKPAPLAVRAQETFLPWLVVFSETATKVPVSSFQSDR